MNRSMTLALVIGLLFAACATADDGAADPSVRPAESTITTRAT